MASEQFNNAENLTTDACPSPPREDSKPSNMEFKAETKRESTSYSQDKKRKSRSKKIPAQAVANVINISNSNGIHIGSNYTINMAQSKKVQDTEEEETITKTEAICELLQQTDPVTTATISFVSEHIGKNWKVVARTLGYSEGQIHQYYDKHFTLGIREVFYQILLDWIQNKPHEATMGILFTALWNAPEKDVVQRAAEKVCTN